MNDVCYLECAEEAAMIYEVGRRLLNAFVAGEGHRFGEVLAYEMNRDAEQRLGEDGPVTSLMVLARDSPDLVARLLWLGWDSACQVAALQHPQGLHLLGQLFQTPQLSVRIPSGLLLAAVLSNGLCSGDYGMEASNGLSDLLAELQSPMLIAAAYAQKTKKIQAQAGGDLKPDEQQGGSSSSKAAAPSSRDISKAAASHVQDIEQIVNKLCTSELALLRLGQTVISGAENGAWAAVSLAIWFVVEAPLRRALTVAMWPHLEAISTMPTGGYDEVSGETTHGPRSR